MVSIAFAGGYVAAFPQARFEGVFAFVISAVVLTIDKYLDLSLLAMQDATLRLQTYVMDEQTQLIERHLQSCFNERNLKNE